MPLIPTAIRSQEGAGRAIWGTPTRRTLSLPADRASHDFNKVRFAIREPDPDKGTPTLIDLAEAITRSSINENAAQEFLPAAAWAVADLIHEARELYDQNHQRWFGKYSMERAAVLECNQQWERKADMRKGVGGPKETSLRLL